MQGNPPSAPAEKPARTVFPPKVARWSLAQALCMLLAFVLLQVMFALLGTLAAKNNSLVGLQASAANLAMLALVWFFLKARTGSDAEALSAIGLLRDRSAVETLRAAAKPLVVCVTGLLAWSLAYALCLQARGVQPPDQPLVKWFIERLEQGAAWQAGTLILAAVVLAPLVEEVMFRGLLYLPLRTKFGPVTAGVIVAAVFAAVHMYAAGAGHFFILGLMLVWLVEATGTLWTPVLVHCLYNGLMIALTIILR